MKKIIIWLILFFSLFFVNNTSANLVYFVNQTDWWYLYLLDDSTNSYKKYNVIVQYISKNICNNKLIIRQPDWFLYSFDIVNLTLIKLTTVNSLAPAYSPDCTSIVYQNWSDWSKLYKKNAFDLSNWTAINSLSSSHPLYSKDWNYILYSWTSGYIYKKSAFDTSNWTAINSNLSTFLNYYEGDYIVYTNLTDWSKTYIKNINEISWNWTVLINKYWNFPFYLGWKIYRTEPDTTISNLYSYDLSVSTITWSLISTYKVQFPFALVWSISWTWIVIWTSTPSSSSSMSWTITSSWSIVMNKTNQTCSWIVFNVDTSSSTPELLNISTLPCTWEYICNSEFLSDVYLSWNLNEVVFNSLHNSFNTYNLFNSWASFTWVFINSYNDFIWYWYTEYDVVWEVSKISLITPNEFVWSNTNMRVDLVTYWWFSYTYNFLIKKNTSYSIIPTNNALIRSYKITISTDSTYPVNVLKSIQYYTNTTWITTTQKTRYECFTPDLSCTWYDYQDPEIQSYCEVNWDYNYIKAEYLPTQYEDNTEKTINLDVSNITDSIDNIWKSFLSWSQNLSDSNTWELNNILNQNNIWNNWLSSLTGSQLYQSFSWIISITTSILSTNYNTGVSFSWTSCWKGNTWYPINFSLPTWPNLSFQNHTVYLPNKKYTPCYTANIWWWTINTEYNNIFKYLLLVIFIWIYFFVLYLFYRYLIFWFFIFIFDLLKKYTSIMSFWFIDSNSPESWWASDLITQTVVFFIITSFFVSFIVFFNYFTWWILTSLFNLIVILKDIFWNLLNFFYTTLINQDTTVFYTTIWYINSSIILLLLWVFNYFIAKKFWWVVAIISIIISLIARFSDFLINIFKDLFSFF